MSLGVSIIDCSHFKGPHDKKTQQRSIDTQERILTATRELFDDLGQNNVTTDMIAAKANVAKGTIFAHFTDRANLTAALGTQDLDQLVTLIRTAQVDAPALEQIFSAYQTLFTLFSKEPEFAKLFVHQSLNSSGKWSDRFTKNTERSKQSCKIMCSSHPRMKMPYLL